MSAYTERWLAVLNSDALPPTCGECIYYRETVWSGRAAQFCARRPPSVLSDGETVWPTVSKNAYCGEWEPFPAIPEESDE